METAVKFLGYLVLGLILAFGLGFVFALPTMWLLNYVLGDTARLAIFGVVHVGYWRAFWTGILFGLLGFKYNHK